MPLLTFPLLDRIASRAAAAPSAPAIVDIPHGLGVSYGELAADIVSLGSTLQATTPLPLAGDETRIALLLSKGYLVPLALLSTWAAGGFALPVLPGLPLPEQSYLVNNADCALIVCDAANRARAEELAAGKDAGETMAIMEISLESLRTQPGDAAVLAALENIDPDRRAMMLYTSGTTGRPKGAVTRHAALAAQVASVVQAWHWSERDNLLHILPLNHLHGICVALLPTLWAGAAVEMWEKFDGPKIWNRWINAERKAPITMFFGVPTVYSKLIQAHRALPADIQHAATKASSTLRLQVSGSAPLPVSVKAAWERDGGVGGGQVLLERYGMTETGLIATNGWADEKRVAGCVGFPMPSVEIRLWDLATNTLITDLETPGEVQVRGVGITKEYWRLPDATAKEFIDGWFKTGDVAVRSSVPGPEHGMYRILGRSSVDIIKSGGEKISAIEIERAILELPGMEDAAVVGVPDEEWGQIVSNTVWTCGQDELLVWVAACIVTTRPALTVDDLRAELRSQLAAFKLPRKLKLFETIPRNGMGKIQKKLIVQNEFGA